MNRAWKVAPLLLTLAACSGDPELDGSWSGSILDASMTLILNEGEDGAVTGTGTLLAVDGGTIPLTITGTHAHPSVSLTFSATGFESFNFTGTLETDDMMSGTVNGSGFVNTPVTLTRSTMN